MLCSRLDAGSTLVVNVAAAVSQAASVAGPAHHRLPSVGAGQVCARRPDWLRLRRGDAVQCVDTISNGFGRRAMHAIEEVLSPKLVREGQEAALVSSSPPKRA